MATFASLLAFPFNLAGVVRQRASITRMFNSVKTALTKLDTALAPKITTDATAAVTLTAATHWTDANGHINKEAILYLTSGSAVAVGFAKAQSDLLPLGAKLIVVQSAGAATITGSGGLTVTARGVVAGGRTAVAEKVTAALWLIDYPALST